MAWSIDRQTRTLECMGSNPIQGSSVLFSIIHYSVLDCVHLHCLISFSHVHAIIHCIYSTRQTQGITRSRAICVGHVCDLGATRVRRDKRVLLKRVSYKCNQNEATSVYRPQ